MFRVQQLICWVVSATFALATPSVAQAEHPFLEMMPLEIKQDASFHELYCGLADRVVVATVSSVTTHESTPTQIQQGLPSIWMEVTYSVERSLTSVSAPQVQQLTLKQPGGVWTSGALTRYSGYPRVQVGKRFMLALSYHDDNYLSPKPMIQRWLSLPAAANLPSNQSVNDAHQEYCNATY